MNPGKSPISGRQITRKEAYKGLGNPKSWKKFSDSVYAQFRAKPTVTKKGSQMSAGGVKIKWPKLPSFLPAKSTVEPHYTKSQSGAATSKRTKVRKKIPRTKH
jgi:hypothetical protein